MKEVLIITKVLGRQDIIGIHQNQKLSKQNIKIVEKSYDDVEILVSSDKFEIKIDNKNISEYSYIYLVNTHLNRELAVSLAIGLEYNKLNFSDPLLAFPYSGGKLIQFTYLKKSNLPFPKTYFVSTKKLKNNNLAYIEKIFNYPFIFKSTTGSKGSENYIIRDRKNLLSIKDLIIDSDFYTNYVFQEYIPNDFDYRILVLRNKCYSVIKRIRQNMADFRNNSALGALEVSEPITDLNLDICNIALNSTIALKIDIAGVDIVVDKYTQRPYLLEINSSPGITIGSNEEKSITEYFNTEVNNNNIKAIH